MTLILTLGNAEQVIQLSDRRLSRDGLLVEDESPKASLLVCRNARMAFGYSGLAKFDNFNTWEWLLDTLYECGPPSYDICGILQRLQDRATRLFSSSPLLSSLPDRNKRCSVLFTGYLDHHTPPLMAYALLTNFQDFMGGSDSEVAWDHFTIFYQNENRPSPSEPTLIQRIGNWRAMHQADELELRSMLEEKKPHQAIIGKAVKLMHTMADRSSSAGSIGKQISYIVIPRSVIEPPVFGYNSELTKNEIILPDSISLLGDGMRALVKSPTISTPDAPLAVKKVGRNAPCPCGSGKKYKKCHGTFRS